MIPLFQIEKSISSLLGDKLSTGEKHTTFRWIKKDAWMFDNNRKRDSLTAQQKTIQDVFQAYLARQPIFANKQALTISFTPETVPHRDDQIGQIGAILAPALRNERPSNLFTYGATGTGKTLVTKFVCSELEKTAKLIGANITILYVNCKLKRAADTEYRLIAALAQQLGRDVPPTGLPTEEVYKTFLSALEERGGVVILVLDEIDVLVKKAGDDILYNLTRINQEINNAKITIVGISNDVRCSEYFDSRVKSSLSEESIIFPPYNATQLRDILSERCTTAFNEGKISDIVIAKCAALAAQEHGDARRALDFLRVAAEIAERQQSIEVLEQHVDHAQSKVDTDTIFEAVRVQPKQSKLVLFSILHHLDSKIQKVLTGDVYSSYSDFCRKVALKPLTQRRISDIIGELDTMGVINAKVISKGRYGRTREISSAISNELQQRLMSTVKSDLYL